MADEAQAPVKKKSKKIFIILILLILLGGSGFAAYYFGLADMILGGGDTTQSAPEAKEDVKASPGSTTTVSVQPFVVNLSNPVGSKHIRLSIDLEMTSENAARQLEQEMVKVRDSIIMLLSSKSYADLAPMEGKLQLKSEIVERVNLILGGPRVVKVYFKDMVFQ
jgi:flagellar FliL protein